MFAKITINSSSKSSTSSATPVANVINSWGNNPIASCTVGISKISMASNIINDLSHAALLLMKEEFGIDEEDSDIKNRDGILIEYGDYKKDMCDTEKKYTEKGLVIYRYGDKGGLRYYVKKYGEFIDEFGDKGYIDLNIDDVNQQSFEHFIDKIAKLNDNKWIHANYSVIYKCNCQTFVIEALKELKPYFNLGNVYPTDSTMATKKSKKKLDFIPSNIKEELEKYFRK